MRCPNCNKVFHDTQIYCCDKCKREYENKIAHPKPTTANQGK